MDVQLTYNTAGGREIVQIVQAASSALLLLGSTTGSRTVAATHRYASVKVSKELSSCSCLFTLAKLLCNNKVSCVQCISMILLLITLLLLNFSIKVCIGAYVASLVNLSEINEKNMKQDVDEAI